jgi:hypothetical protein
VISAVRCIGVISAMQFSKKKSAMLVDAESAKKKVAVS